MLNERDVILGEVVCEYVCVSYCDGVVVATAWVGIIGVSEVVLERLVDTGVAG